VASDGLICCRYCGHFFSDGDFPTYRYRAYNPDKRLYEEKEVAYEFKRCPSCLHVLDYEVSSGVPSIVVWKMQYRINPDTNKFEFRHEQRYLRELRRKRKWHGGCIGYDTKSV
jgi:hypothetical protein